VITKNIDISLQFDLATGKVNLNEIVFRIKELKDQIMLALLKNILMFYDDLINERLRETKIYPKKMIKGLGRHKRKNDPWVDSARDEKSVDEDTAIKIVKYHSVWTISPAFAGNGMLHMRSPLFSSFKCSEDG
jgi:hypothetical protein